MAADGMTVEEKKELLKELREAIYTGALRVKFNERDVTYRSLAEMRQIAKDLEDEICNAETGRKRKRVGLASWGSGLE